MQQSFYIRKATPADVEAISSLFYFTVTEINVKDYTADQVKIWAAKSEDTPRWTEKINTQHFLAAVLKKENKIVGFGAITPAGYLDVLFVDKDFQKLGIAKALVTALQSFAKENKLITITADVSITAKPFFEKMGFKTVHQQTVFLDNIPFINFKMLKEI